MRTRFWPLGMKMAPPAMSPEPVDVPLTTFPVTLQCVRTASLWRVTPPPPTLPVSPRVAVPPRMMQLDTVAPVTSMQPP